MKTPSRLSLGIITLSLSIFASLSSTPSARAIDESVEAIESAIQISPWIGLEPEFDGRFKSGAKKILSGQSPFGVYDPEVEAVKGELLEQIEKMNREAPAKLLSEAGRLTRVERVPHKYSEPEKGREIMNFKLTFEYPGGKVDPFWIVLASDPATIEIQTKPVTFKQMSQTYRKTLEHFLYEPAAKIGLKPRYKLGSNHFHIGTATAFYDVEEVSTLIKGELIKGDAPIPDETRKLLIPRRERPAVFKDFIISLFNNPALALYADDFYSFANAPHPQWNPKRIKAIQKALKQLPDDAGIHQISTLIQDAYLASSPIDPNKHNPAKYVFLNLTRTAGAKYDYTKLKLDRLKVPSSFDSIEDFDAFYERTGLKDLFSQTIEARGIGGQKSFAEYFDIITLHIDRLEYLRRLDAKGLGGKVPFISIGVPRTEEQMVAQLLYFVRETYEGLGWKPKRIEARWERLAQLIRKKSIRRKAEKVSPYDHSLGELAQIAYFDDALNIYRMQCVRLMQKAMNLFPDGKAK